MYKYIHLLIYSKVYYRLQFKRIIKYSWNLVYIYCSGILVEFDDNGSVYGDILLFTFYRVVYLDFRKNLQVFTCNTDDMRSTAFVVYKKIWEDSLLSLVSCGVPSMDCHPP